MLEEYVTNMLASKAIERTDRPVCGSIVFSVPRENSSKLRFILDVKRLIRNIHCPKFKMTTLTLVRQCLPPGAWFASIDLSEAYYHVPVHRSFRRYLAFRIGDQTYRFRAMPFGLCVAPRIFTKLIDVLIGELRSAGVFVIAYLVDWLVWGESQSHCQANVTRCLVLLRDKGFVVNFSKSSLEPVQSIKYLDVIWDARECTFLLPEALQLKVVASLQDLFRRLVVSRRQLERTIGLLNFAILVDPTKRPLLNRLQSFLRDQATEDLRDLEVPMTEGLRAILAM